MFAHLPLARQKPDWIVNGGGKTDLKVAFIRVWLQPRVGVKVDCHSILLLYSNFVTQTKARVPAGHGLAQTIVATSWASALGDRPGLQGGRCGHALTRASLRQFAPVDHC